MNYLEFVKNGENQMVETIRFRDDAVESFFAEMEEANYGGRFLLITSLYNEVVDYIRKECDGRRIRIVKLNGTDYEMHIHMFTTYLVSMLYESQYWEILLDALELYSSTLCILVFEDYFRITLYNLLRKLTKEPIENFVKEVQIVCPEYTL